MQQTIWWEVGCLHEVFHRERVLRIVITRHVNVCQRAKRASEPKCALEVGGESE